MTEWPSSASSAKLLLSEPFVIVMVLSPVVAVLVLIYPTNDSPLISIVNASSPLVILEIDAPFSVNLADVVSVAGVNFTVAKSSPNTLSLLAKVTVVSSTTRS